MRDQLSAALFGGGALMDAFTIAFRIPNLLRDLFAEGALSTAFTTDLQQDFRDRGRRGRLEARQQGLHAGRHRPERHHRARCASSPLVGGRPGARVRSREKAALTITLTRVMYPFILLVSVAALAMGMLNARNVFGVPAMASSFFNLGSIIVGVGLGWWLDPGFGPRALLGLAIGTLVGGALQLAVQLPALRRAGYVFRPDFHGGRGRRAILRLMGPRSSPRAPCR